MGAGQIGGFATLLDLDFKNAAGFLGNRIPEDASHPNFLVYFLSHAMMFCVGTVIEAHVILVPAACVYGERYKFEVYGGTHKFLEQFGIGRKVEHFAIHKNFNKSSCMSNNVGVLVLAEQFDLTAFEKNSQAEFVVGRARYEISSAIPIPENGLACEIYGWGSRRNGYLVPLLLILQKVQLVLMPHDHCDKMWNCNKQFLCVQQQQCKSPRFGALCPDDFGTPLICSGYVRGMMVSRLVDRPCGVGYLDMTKYVKFLTCSVDDSQEIMQDTMGVIMFNSLDLDHSIVKSVTIPPEVSYGKRTPERIQNQHG